MNFKDDEVGTNPYLEIAERIIQRSEEMRIKQSDIASYLGLSKSTVSVWLRGESKPRTNQLKGLAEILKTTATWILSGDTSVEGHTVFPPININMVGERVRNAIWDKKITRVEVAKHLGVSATTIGNWCNGKLIPNHAKSLDLSEFLNVTPEWLIYGQSVALDTAGKERAKFITESKLISQSSAQEHSQAQANNENSDIVVKRVSNDVMQKQAQLTVSELWNKAHQQGFDEGYAKALEDFNAGLEK